MQRLVWSGPNIRIEPYQAHTPISRFGNAVDIKAGPVCISGFDVAKVSLTMWHDNA